MDKDLYTMILDFVFTCKKLQYNIKQKYVPESKEPLLREFGLKNIPRNGEIILENRTVNFWIHGSGISYQINDQEFSHTFYLGKGLDIIFNLYEVLRYNDLELSEDYKHEMKSLENRQLIEKLLKQSEVYFLK